MEYAYESNYKTDVIYIDFRKVFDTVPHNLHRNKLLQYNYCLPTVNWKTQLLANRTQYVCVNGSKSSIAAVSSGIIQSEPALFVLYVNDISSVCHVCRVNLYADGVKIYNVIKCSRLNDNIFVTKCTECYTCLVASICS